MYGNIIFIKKTGGDGSKFPVTQKDIKIGRSEDCLIRIYNSQVAPEHCQLIVGDNGQTTLRNLSSQTILNGKPLGREDVTLCHGDIFQLGERLARWEYLPTSKYYRQLLSPTGRLVAVVMPQQRSLGEQATPGSSASQGSVLKSTPLGKRRYSERAATENSSSLKIRKSSGNDLLRKVKGDLPKLLTGRHSLKATKLLLQGTKIRERKSISVVRSKTPKAKFTGKSRKSTLPSWKVNIVTPERKSPGTRKSVTRAVDSSEGSVKSVSKSLAKTPLKSIAESPSKTTAASVRSTRSFSKSPSPKKNSPKPPSKIVLSTPKQKPPKLERLVQSESKINSRSGKRSSFPKKTNRMSLILEKSDSTSGRSLSKRLNESIKVENLTEGIVSDSVVQTPVTEKQIRKSVKITPGKITLGSLEKTPRKSLLESVKTPTQAKSSRKSVVKTPGSHKGNSKTPKMATLSEVVGTPLLINFDSSTPVNKKSTRKSSKSTIERKTSRKSGTSIRKSSAGRKNSVRRNETSSSASSSPDVSLPLTSIQTPRKSMKEKRLTSPSKTRISSPRGVRRKLSPSSSAERAAKMLKTSSPKKPDKNKKAALLVLGKASRKQLLSQNVKVLLKQKIVKRAIKQSAAGIPQKVDGRKKIVTELKKEVKKSLKTKRKPSKKEKQTKKHTPVKVLDAAVKSPASTKPQEVTPKGKTLEASLSSPSKIPPSLHSSKSKPVADSPSNQKSEPSPSGSFEQATENYLFNSNRRSKRLSSKNDTGRPDFIELSPTALGLMPKHVNVFKTPKESKRRSSSLATPKNIQTTGIIKSASTSKIGNRKSVRFSSKDVYSSEFHTPYAAEKLDFDFSSIHTPDVTLDVFVSPLNENSTKKDVNGIELGLGGISKTASTRISRSSTEPKTCVRKLLQSPQNKKVSPVKKTPVRIEQEKSAKNSPNDLKGVRRLFATPKPKKSSKESLSDLKGVPRLFRTSKTTKGPKNDLTDVTGVRKLFQASNIQKSPKNDLSDVRGVKKLLKTPKTRKSPKNDLTDVRGVKKLLQTPKEQKSPKNDLTDVRGVKKLLQTPKEHKSPKNDLTDVKGVKKLMTTPKLQKSPKNDLTNLDGVKQLLGSPKIQKSPKNDLSDLRGVKKLLGSPKIQKSPRNDLSDVKGVKKLLTTPRVQKSPKNNLLEVSGVGSLFESPVVQTANVNVTQLLVSKSPESVLEGSKRISRKPHVKGFKAIRGRRTIHSSPKQAKNDLSDVTGVRELFSRHKPISDYNISLTGVAELFDLPEVATEEKPSRKSTARKTVKFLKESESEGEKTAKRRGRPKKVVEEESEKKPERSKRTAVEVEEEKPVKRKAVAKKSEDETKTKSQGRKKAAPAEDLKNVKTSRKRKAATENVEASPPKSRRKSAAVEKSTSTGVSKRVATESKKKISSEEKVTLKSNKKNLTKGMETTAVSKVQSKSAIKTGTKRIPKVQSRSQSISKSDPDGETKTSPRKTRSGKAVGVNKTTSKKVSKTQSKGIGKKTAKSTAGRCERVTNKPSPVAKRSTRRK